jgi:hypothetical protein
VLGARGVHLFQAGPLALAVMVGYLWNRMPMTQLYEDLGPRDRYAPTFSIWMGISSKPSKTFEPSSSVVTIISPNWCPP